MPFGCALRGTAAPALPLRLLLGADVFDARLDRFFAMSSLPFLNRGAEAGLAVMRGLGIIVASVSDTKVSRSSRFGSLRSQSQNLARRRISNWRASVSGYRSVSQAGPSLAEMKQQQTGARSCAANRESARWQSHDRFDLIDTAAL
jgi:hypothetical protein